ncbi:MAG TPA: GTPase HflX [Clostridia bacterium]|nr:GTPase HflX [Clostridia bacterium]
MIHTTEKTLEDGQGWISAETERTQQNMKREIHGNTGGIRDIVLNEMMLLYDMEMSADEFLSDEVCDALVHFTSIINREVLIYVSRVGKIEDIRVGDDHSVHMEEMRLVRNIDRLSGVRCIHTHPNETGYLSDVDLGSLNALRLDAMCAIGVKDGRASSVYAAFVGEMEGEERVPVWHGPMRAHHLPQKQLMDAIFEADKRLLSDTYNIVEIKPDRAVLAGIESADGYDTLGELAELCQTAGIKVVAKEQQRRRAVDAATYIGSGKAEELALLASACEADIFVFDDELTAIQLRNLELVLGLPIIDRTMLILDIFAQRAQSREGKLQVELAQLKYRLPRLLGMGKVLSRQGASGVGMRGPGEKKLEIDRRRIRRRVFELEQELNEIEKQRGLRRAKRAANPIPVVALVGYTNAGKSTLLNLLSGADALAEDKLFATLDPIVRKITLPNGTECLLSDTVGFINKLPHDLVNAFRSTLDEVNDADLVLHVVDSSSEYFEVQMRVVEEVLGSLGALDTPRIEVYNKIDKPEAKPRSGGVAISAVSSAGIDSLLHAIEEALAKTQVKLDVVVPYDKHGAMQMIRQSATILAESHEEDGTHLTLLLNESETWRIKKAISG